MDAHLPPALQALWQAIDAHDLDRLAACFDVDYRNETPVHPARSFTGRAQVRENWAKILRAVPDLSATLVRWTAGPSEPGTVWAEWDWSGTRADGAPFRMRGVTVLGTAEDAIGWARFYMEPVDENRTGVTVAVAAAVGSDERSVR